MLRLASVLALAAPCLAQGYEVVTIPIRNPFSINNHGTVAGDFFTQTGSVAAIWSPQKGLRVLNNGDSEARGLNARGVVVGSSQQRAVVWTHRGMQDLGAGHQSSARAVNDAGFVVGTYATGDPFLWHPAMGIMNLTPLMGSRNPSTISNTWIAGQHFAWSPRHGLIDPGMAVFDINDHGQAVGLGTAGATVWSLSAGLQNLHPAGATRSLASGINNRGQIVGSADYPSGERRALLWDDGQVIDLNTYAPPGHRIEEALAINDRGWITARGTHSFLLIPH